MENLVVIMNGVQFPECSDIEINREIKTGQRVIPIHGEKVMTFESKYTFTISWEGLSAEYMEQMNAIFSSPAGIMLTVNDDYSQDGIFNQKRVLLQSIKTKATSNGTNVEIQLVEQEKVEGIR